MFLNSFVNTHLLAHLAVKTAECPQLCKPNCPKVGHGTCYCCWHLYVVRVEHKNMIQLLKNVRIAMCFIFEQLPSLRAYYFILQQMNAHPTNDER